MIEKPFDESATKPSETPNEIGSGKELDPERNREPRERSEQDLDYFVDEAPNNITNGYMNFIFEYKSNNFITYVRFIFPYLISPLQHKSFWCFIMSTLA